MATKSSGQTRGGHHGEPGSRAQPHHSGTQEMAPELTQSCEIMIQRGISITKKSSRNVLNVELLFSILLYIDSPGHLTSITAAAPADISGRAGRSDLIHTSQLLLGMSFSHCHSVTPSHVHKPLDLSYHLGNSDKHGPEQRSVATEKDVFPKVFSSSSSLMLAKPRTVVAVEK